MDPKLYTLVLAPWSVPNGGEDAAIPVALNLTPPPPDIQCSPSIHASGSFIRQYHNSIREGRKFGEFEVSQLQGERIRFKGPAFRVQGLSLLEFQAQSTHKRGIHKGSIEWASLGTWPQTTRNIDLLLVAIPL